MRMAQKQDTNYVLNSDLISPLRQWRNGSSSFFQRGATMAQI
jgi:hypothetical protein